MMTKDEELIEIVKQYVDERCDLILGELKQVRQIYEGTPDEKMHVLNMMNDPGDYTTTGFTWQGLPVHPVVYAHMMHMARELRRHGADKFPAGREHYCKCGPYLAHEHFGFIGEATGHDFEKCKYG